MMRSLFAGVSGLKNHQTRMDVIGNNIANVNTIGFKRGRAIFKDALYQSIRGATTPTGNRGGTNPMGIGLGMTLSSLDQIHTAAPPSITNRATDMAVDGNGFFVLGDGGQVFYSRAGNFDFDTRGYLVAGSGYLVQGWMADENGVVDSLQPLRGIDISGYKIIAPKATENMVLAGNLDSTLAIPQFDDAASDQVNIDPEDAEQYPSLETSIVTSKTVYDSLGNEIIIYLRFFKHEVTNDDPPVTSWACDISLDSEFEEMDEFDTGASFAAFDIHDDATDATLEPGDEDIRMIRAYNLQFDTGGAILDPTKAKIELKLDRSFYGADDVEVEIDFSLLTQFNAIASARVASQDGYAVGSLVSYNIGVDGTIQGVYDNGRIMNMARVALANFQNPSGLSQVGSNLYQESSNSGAPFIGGPGLQGMGDIVPSSLEMSNVDLSEEFTDMIVTQRGFQANSRVITASDEMLQELVNLKR